MEQNPLCIAFASQKGGVGKSTLTVLAASWLHYLHGIRVAVVDCDYPQHSILKLSNRDKATVPGRSNSTTSYRSSATAAHFRHSDIASEGLQQRIR